MKRIPGILFILVVMSGCVTTKILSFEEAAFTPEQKSGKRDFLIVYNQNNQYELHNYRFRNDTLEGQIFVPKVDRSNGIMVFTSPEFALTGNISESVTKIPLSSVYKIQEVKPDLFRTVAFAAGIAIITFGLWSAGNLVMGGIF